MESLSLLSCTNLLSLPAAHDMFVLPILRHCVYGQSCRNPFFGLVLMIRHWLTQILAAESGVVSVKAQKRTLCDVRLLGDDRPFRLKFWLVPATFLNHCNTL